MLTCELRCSSTHKCDETCSVDDASAGMQTLGLIDGVLAHGEDSVLAPPPDAFHVDLHRQIPYALLGVERIVVCGVHDARVVELE